MDKDQMTFLDGLFDQAEASLNILDRQTSALLGEMEQVPWAARVGEDWNALAARYLDLMKAQAAIGERLSRATAALRAGADDATKQ